MLKVLFILLFSNSLYAQEVILSGESFLDSAPKACSVSYSVESADGQTAEIVNFNFQGPVETWEILSENEDGYGSSSDIVHHVSSDEDLSMRFTMNRPSIINSFKWDYASNVSIGEGLKLASKFSLLIAGELEQPTKISYTTKFSSFLIPLGTQKFECNFNVN